MKRDNGGSVDHRETLDWNIMCDKTLKGDAMFQDTFKKNLF